VPFILDPQRNIAPHRLQACASVSDAKFNDDMCRTPPPRSIPHRDMRDNTENLFQPRRKTAALVTIISRAVPARSPVAPAQKTVAHRQPETPVAPRQSCTIPRV
jgi:hypothetical protein